MSALSNGDRVWVSHPEDAWIVGHIKTINARTADVTTEKRGIIQVDLTQTPLEPCGDHIDLDIDNLVDLDELSEGAILHHTRKRFSKKLIYTYVGPILVAVNPFESLPIYGNTDIRQAKSHATLYPHIFITAAVAYRQLDENKKSQSCLISGESGAGKTETTKKVLTYLAAVAPGDAQAGDAGIEERILMSNPLLEALGNAKTLRNNNSSRFGKYIKLEFNTALKIRGCEIVNYLLEKSRVVTQSSMERNYHIFYHLCSMSDAQLKQDLMIMDAMEYAYLNTSGCVQVQGMDDAKEFEEVQAAMKMLNISQETSMSMFKLVSAVLMLGNVKFKPVPSADSESMVDPASSNELEMIAQFLQVDVTALSLAMTSKNMMVGRENVTVKFNVAAAVDCRDTLAKSLYSNMFDSVVQIVNGTLASKEPGAAPFYIGILDIFGFEIFEKNSFEQLCINYANEKLQFHFNSVIFGQEQAMYAAEGVPLEAIEFVDNGKCVELIEGKPYGLISLLEEECSLGGGKDSSYISKVEKAFGKNRAQANPHFAKHKTKPTIFSVTHFAGAVEYAVEGWLDKNRDTMSPTLKQTMQESGSSFIGDLFNDGASPAEASPSKGKGGQKGKSTLGTQFRTQLIQLLESLGATEPHFVRCVKPNHAKVGGIIESKLVLGQMKYSGLFEAIRIRKSGYAYRASHAVFAQTYQLLADNVYSALKKGTINARQACERIVAALSKEGIINSKSAVVGNTKMFLKNNSDRAILDRYKRSCTERFVVRIQNMFRSHLAYIALNKMKWESQKEMRRVALEKERALRLALILQSHKRGQTDREFVAKMQPILDMRNAVKSKDVSAILATIDSAENLKNGLLDGEIGKGFRIEIKKAKQICAVLEMQVEFIYDLEIAIEANDLEEIQRLAHRAHHLEMRENPLVEKAESRLVQASQQLHVMKQMVNFLKNCEHTSFDPRGLLDDAKDLGVDEEFIFKCKRVYQTTGPLLKAKFGIRTAVERVDKHAIKGSLQDVLALQKYHPDFCADEVLAAQQMLKMLAFQANMCPKKGSGDRLRTDSGDAEGGETEEKNTDEDGSDDGPRLTPSTIDLCEIICSTEDSNLARKAQSRLSLMTRTGEDMEELVRCFKWSKLFCTWKYPENAKREAKDAGTTHELVSRRRSVAMGLLGGSVNSEVVDSDFGDVDEEPPEFDFFGLRACEARSGSHLKRVLKSKVVHADDVTAKKPSETEQAAKERAIADNTELPDGVAEMMKKLETLTHRKEKHKIAVQHAAIVSGVDAKGVFSSIQESKSKASKQHALLQKMSERTQEGARLRREATRAAFEADRTSTLVPPSPTRLFQSAVVKAPPKTKYCGTITSVQEQKLLASKKAADKQRKLKKAAFAHLEKEVVHRFKV